MEFNFTIDGNQEKASGNPIPYHRVVGKALWLPAARRYNAWKIHVRKSFFAAYPRMMANKSLEDPPIDMELGPGSRMDIKIKYGSLLHADNDNIFKGIADALFENDKGLNGSFESSYTTDKKPIVEVKIIIKQK